MLIAVVKSPVVSTVKHEAYRGQKLFVVKPIHPVSRSEYSQAFVAIDFVDAGVGDIVLVSQEGSAARDLIGDKKAPVRSFIVAIVDGWEIEE